MEILVPWKEEFAVVDAGLWSTLSTAPKVKRSSFNELGQTIFSLSYFLQSCCPIESWISCTLLYCTHPAGAKSLTTDFFLIYEWIIKPVLIGSGGSFALKWWKCESPNFHLVLTALNQISWERFTSMAWVFPKTCWCCDVPSKIRLTRWISSFSMDAVCFCCERSPSNTWSELKRWWHMILAAWLKIIPLSKDEVFDASNIEWPTCSSKVKGTSFPFFCHISN